MKQFLSRKRFNVIDVLGYVVAAPAMAAGHYLLAAVLIAGFGLVSSIVEAAWA